MSNKNKVIRFIKWLKDGPVVWLTLSRGSKNRRAIKKNAIALKNYVDSKPTLRRTVIRVLQLFPSLKHRLKVMGTNPSDFAQIDIENLSPKAYMIYEELLSRQQKVRG